MDVVGWNARNGSVVSTTTFGGVALGVSTGSETGVAMAVTVAAGLLAYWPVAFAVKVMYPLPLIAVQVKLNICVPVPVIVALVGVGAPQLGTVNTGAEPPCVPPAAELTVKVGATLVAVAGPTLLTVTDTVAVSPAFI